MQCNLFAIKIKMHNEIICTKNLDKPPVFVLSLIHGLFRLLSVDVMNAWEPAGRF